MRAPEEFETERLRLRPVGAADAAEIFEVYARHAAPTKYMPFIRHRSLTDSEAFAARCDGCWATGAAFPWAITDSSSGRLMGVMELRLSPPKADFGYILGEAFWGRGYATEAGKAVVQWVIQQPSIFRLWATCHPDNAASVAVLRKLGLAFEATLANWEARPQLGEIAGSSHCYALSKPVA